MTKEQVFEKAVQKAHLINRSVFVYQRANGRWFMTTRKCLIPKGVFNYRMPLFEFEPTAEAVL